MDQETKRLFKNELYNIRELSMNRKRPGRSGIKPLQAEMIHDKAGILMTALERVKITPDVPPAPKDTEPTYSPKEVEALYGFYGDAEYDLEQAEAILMIAMDHIQRGKLHGENKHGLERILRLVYAARDSVRCIAERLDKTNKELAEAFKEKQAA